VLDVVEHPPVAYSSRILPQPHWRIFLLSLVHSRPPHRRSPASPTQGTLHLAASWFLFT
jgi:hypothetical protein